jgi:hypothetical protein
MNAHLNEQQFGELVLGTGNAEIAAHIETCDVCRAEAEGVRTAISGCRELAKQSEEHDEVFWARQRLAIRQRLARHRFIPQVRWVATAAMVLVVSAALLLTRAPQPVQQANNDAADDALLQQVQSDLGRDYPAALAPAVLIDVERNSALSASAKQSSNQ